MVSAVKVVFGLVIWSIHGNSAYKIESTKFSVVCANSPSKQCDYIMTLTPPIIICNWMNVTMVNS